MIMDAVEDLCEVSLRIEPFTLAVSSDLRLLSDNSLTLRNVCVRFGVGGAPVTVSDGP